MGISGKANSRSIVQRLGERREELEQRLAGIGCRGAKTSSRQLSQTRRALVRVTQAIDRLSDTRAG